MPNNIFPSIEQAVPRDKKEGLLKQHSIVIWFTGLSGSGKSTLAEGLEKRLFEQGYLTQILDGDTIRTGINNNLGFSEEDRTENIRRIAEVSKLFLNCGIITLCAFISPTNKIRSVVEKIVGKENFYEVFVSTPIEECEKRDIKGLYAKARRGELPGFTGVDAPFEIPGKPYISIDTSEKTVEESLNILYDCFLPIVQR